MNTQMESIGFINREEKRVNFDSTFFENEKPSLTPRCHGNACSFVMANEYYALCAN